MKVPCFHNRAIGIVAFIAACGFASWALAQPPPVAAPPAELNSARPPRTKPQVIYHLPPASNYAAALHSQAKTPHDAPPAGNDAPTSRPAANDTPAKVQQEPVAPRVQMKSSPSVRSVKRHSSGPRSVMRVHPAGKGHGHGSGHGNKSHHK
jgi:hypothetical protein